MKVLLDVGAHTGETAREVVDPRYGFDRIYCFEPAASCWPDILGIGDPRVELCKFGLWNATCEKELYRPGFLGASIFSDMTNLGRERVESTTIKLVRATDWFKEHVNAGDTVFLKLNCEGSECDVIDDLLDSGELRKVYNAMIDFDVRHVPSLRGREVEVRRRLRQGDYHNVSFTEDVMKGATHADRIRNWLGLVGGAESLPVDELRRKYHATLVDLSSRTGTLPRLKLALRRNLFDPLPAPAKDLVRAAYRQVRARLSPG
jgi:FkbM family methyltransferase